MKKILKNMTKVLAVAAIAALSAFSSYAADNYSVGGLTYAFINTTTTTNLVGTNLVVCGTTRSTAGIYWTNSINAAYTNITLLPSPNGNLKDTCIEFDAAIPAALATSTNVIWALGRNLSGGSTTNANGSPMKLELFAYVTNTIPVGLTVGTTVVNMSSLPSTPNNVNVVTSFNDGGIPNFYVFSVTPAAGVVLTNTTAYTTGL